jgi:hypothetical protein
VIVPIVSEVIVSTRTLFRAALVSWPALVVALLALRIVSGAAVAPASYGAWMFLAAAPMLVAVLVLNGIRPTRSVAHVLYDAEHATVRIPPPAPIRG